MLECGIPKAAPSTWTRPATHQQPRQDPRQESTTRKWDEEGSKTEEHPGPRQFPHPAQEAHKVAEAKAERRKVHPTPPTSDADPPPWQPPPNRTHRTGLEVVKVEQGTGGSDFQLLVPNCDPYPARRFELRDFSGGRRSVCFQGTLEQQKAWVRLRFCSSEPQNKLEL